MSRLYEERYTTTSGGNLSLKTAEGEIYITPGGFDKGELREEQIVRIGADGRRHGKTEPSCEWPLHRNIYRLNSAYRAIVHAHPPVLVGYSLAHRVPDVRLFPLMWEDGAVELSQYGAPGSERLMNHVGTAMTGSTCAVIMANHGAIVASKDGLHDAYCRFAALVAYAQAESCARQWNNGAVDIPGAAEVEALKAMLQEPTEQTAEGGKLYRNERRALAYWLQRAVGQKLIHASFGAVSLRVGKDSFLVNRLGVDRKQADGESFVLVREGKMLGGAADTTWQLHREVYRKNPELSAAITAYCPHVMGMLAGDHRFDVRCVPESFLVLREFPVAAIGEFLQDISAVTGRLNEKQHIAGLKNGFVMTVGRDLKEAFNTLEVAEFDAWAAMEAGYVGELVPLSWDDVAEMKAALQK